MTDLDLMSPQELAQELGARLRQERLRRNWTQRSLAERAGVSRLTVTRVERGDSISLRNFLAMLVALGRAGDLANILDVRVNTTIDEFLATSRPARRRGRR